MGVIADGTISIDGELVYRYERNDRTIIDSEKRIETIRPKVGMVFQSFNLLPHLTVEKSMTTGPVDVLGTSTSKASEDAHSSPKNIVLLHKSNAYPHEI